MVKLAKSEKVLVANISVSLFAAVGCVVLTVLFFLDNINSEHANLAGVKTGNLRNSNLVAGAVLLFSQLIALISLFRMVSSEHDTKVCIAGSSSCISFLGLITLIVFFIYDISAYQSVRTFCNEDINRCYPCNSRYSVEDCQGQANSENAGCFYYTDISSVCKPYYIWRAFASIFVFVIGIIGQILSLSMIFWSIKMLPDYDYQNYMVKELKIIPRDPEKGEKGDLEEEKPVNEGKEEIKEEAKEEIKSDEPEFIEGEVPPPPPPPPIPSSVLKRAMEQEKLNEEFKEGEIPPPPPPPPLPASILRALEGKLESTLEESEISSGKEIPAPPPPPPLKLKSRDSTQLPSTSDQTVAVLNPSEETIDIEETPSEMNATDDVNNEMTVDEAQEKEEEDDQQEETVE